jgi:hypothetical protein
MLLEQLQTIDVPSLVMNMLINDYGYEPNFTRSAFNDALKIFAPSISTEIQSLYNNPESASANTVYRYLFIYNTSVINFLYDYMDSTDNLSALQALVDQAETRDLTGRVLLTDLANWKTFSSAVSQYKWRSFTAVTSGNNLAVFFL